MSNKYDPILVELLQVLIKLRVVSANQIYRFFDESERIDVQNTINNAIKKRLFGRQIIQIPAPREGNVRAGSGSKVPVEVYFLENLGRKAAEKYFKNTKYARVGRPNGIHLGRVYHDLLITESLFWCMKNYDVATYFNEDELRADGEILADLRVVIRTKDGLKELDCEITVQNTRQDIEEKTDNLLWFSPSLRKCDAIERLKKAPVIHLNLQHNLPLKPIPRAELTTQERHIKFVIDLNGGALTGAAVARITEKDAGYIRTILKKMEQAGLLFACSVHANPGVQTGRPHKLYANYSEDLIMLDDRIRALKVSQNAY